MAGALFCLFLFQLILVAPEELEVRNPNEFLKVDEWDERIQQNMKGILLVEAKSQRKIWELKADQAQALRESNSWAMSKVNAKFFSKNGIVYDVIAGETRFDSETKNMQFKGDVFVKSSNGYNFNTNQLRYSTEEESLLSDTEVLFEGFSAKKADALKMRGDRMAIQLESGVAQIMGNVVSEKFEANNQNLKFHSENVILSNDGSEARFQKDVEIKYEDMLLKGPEAIVKYDKSNKSAKSLDIIDGVEVETVDKNAASERLHLDIAKENLILEGRPRLLQKGDELLGTAIIFKNRGKSLEVKGAKAHLNSGSSGTVLDE